MTDLVERLRRWRHGSCLQLWLMQDAADEIERLRSSQGSTPLRSTDGRGAVGYRDGWLTDGRAWWGPTPAWWREWAASVEQLGAQSTGRALRQSFRDFVRYGGE